MEGFTFVVSIIFSIRFFNHLVIYSYVEFIMRSLLSIVNVIILFFSKVRPLRLKQYFFSFMFHWYLYVSHFKSLLFQIRLNISIVYGIEKHTGSMVRFLFVSNEKFPLFLMNLIYNGKPTVKKIGKEYIWGLKKVDKMYSDDVDAVLVSCDQFYYRWLCKSGMYVFPHLVDMVLDCSIGINEILEGLPRSTKKEIKKVKKRKYSFEVTSDIEKVTMFYQDMYLPTFLKRIGETDMFIPDLLSIKYLLEMGYELMLVTYEGKYVCGGFFYHYKDTLMLKYSGVFEGNIDLIKNRAHSAVYYFFIILAQDRKVKRVDLGGARPFFNDGLFQYKKKWGTIIEPYSLVPEVFGLKILNNSESLKQFLIHNPFIGLNEKNEMVGFVFVDKDELSDEEKEHYEKRFDVPGIHELRFITL